MCCVCRNSRREKVSPRISADVGEQGFRHISVFRASDHNADRDVHFPITGHMLTVVFLYFLFVLFTRNKRLFRFFLLHNMTKQDGWLPPTERASVSAHFGLPWVRSWDNRGKCYMDGKRIQCCSNASQ